MLPILITGGSVNERKKKAYELAAHSMGVSPDKLESQPDLYLITPGPSITIAQIRKLVTDLSRKPLQSPVSVAVLLEANLATIDAQNALLKTLEEPFPSSYIILTSPNKDLLLPTVVSRCREISLSTPINSKLEQTKEKEISTLIDFFLSNQPEKRLAKIDQITLQKQETLEELENLIRIAETKLRSSNDKNEQDVFAPFIRAADKARKHISANVNIRLAIANFLLSF